MDIIVQVWRYTDMRNPKMQQRQKEIEYCIRTHFLNPNIRQVHLLVSESDVAYFREKFPTAVFTVTDGQAKYSQLIDYANQLLPRRVVCICNTDIEIGGFDENILNELDRKTAFAITRQNIVIGGPPSKYQIENYGGSHDAFIFRSPIAVSSSRLVFRQNLFGAENVLMFELERAGYTLKNPCLQLPVFHHHKDDIYFEKYTRINTSDRSSVCPPTYLGTYDEGHRIHLDSP